MHRFQFCTRYSDNVYVYNRVFWVIEFKDGAKGVAMVTKVRQK